MKYTVFTNTMIFGYLELSWEYADRQKKNPKSAIETECQTVGNSTRKMLNASK